MIREVAEAQTMLLRGLPPPEDAMVILGRATGKNVDAVSAPFFRQTNRKNRQTKTKKFWGGPNSQKNYKYKM
jgi:hypothetical protein